MTMTIPFITAVLSAITAVRAEKFNEDALDSAVSLLLFTFSSVRALVFQGTYIALSPARLTWKSITWLCRNGVLGIAHLTSYPVVPFLLTAIGCGLVIGGCAGFAVEAFSSILLSATWGKPTPRQDVTHENEEGDISFSAELKHRLDDEQIDDNHHDYDHHDSDHHDNEEDETEVMYTVLKKHLEEASQKQELRRRQQRTI